MLELSNISMSYSGVQILNRITLSFCYGQSYVLLGESGAGKTTLIKLIAGLADHYDGVISLEGQPLKKSVRKRSFTDCARIQYLFQDPYSTLDPHLSVRHVLRKAEQLCRRHRAAYLDGGQALSLVDERLIPLLDYPVGQLSGGQRQKVCLARALIPKPRILLADESCSMLDHENSLEIYRLLNQLKRNLDMCILAVMHDLDFSYTEWDQLLLIHQGEIIEHLPYASFFDQVRSTYAQEMIAAYHYFDKGVKSE